MKLFHPHRRHTPSRRTPRRRHRPERGMTTAEYTVGTLGACTVGGVLVKIGQSEWFGDLVKDLLEKIPGMIPGL